jgi:hypothetical protein
VGLKVTKIGKSSVTLNVDNLSWLQKKLLMKHVAQVGIFGNKSGRGTVVVNKKGNRVRSPEPAYLTNPELGLIHEKGSLSLSIPRRSFLEETFRHQAIEWKAIKKQLWESFIKKEINIKRAYQLLAVEGYKLVDKAFQTGGFGKWRVLKPKTIKRKGSSAILIDSAQLRKSVYWRVK